MNLCFADAQLLSNPPGTSLIDLLGDSQLNKPISGIAGQEHGMKRSVSVRCSQSQEFRDQLCSFTRIVQIPGIDFVSFSQSIDSHKAWQQLDLRTKSICTCDERILKKTTFESSGNDSKSVEQTNWNDRD
jgi:hypothetical protein